MTFLFNMEPAQELGDHRALGFHHLESPAGQAILAAVEGARVEPERAV